MIKKISWLICFLSLTSPAINAETKYVTDDLKLALHAQEGSKGELLQRLQSGTKLEVLEENGLFAKVRTPDGTVGWTKAGFLMTDKPARARVIELEQVQAQLEKDLQESQAQLAESKKLAGELRAEKIQSALELAGFKEDKTKNADLIEQVRKENEALQERLQSLKGRLPSEWSIPLEWGLFGAAAFLVVGILAGFALFDWLSRRRHGGIRIY